MNASKMLPIGSVVIMKNGTKPLMIFGYLQKDSSNPDKIFDYSAVMFPEGNIGPQHQFLLNHSDIAKVLHLGMEDSGRIPFIESILKAMKQ